MLLVTVISITPIVGLLNFHERPIQALSRSQFFWYGPVEVIPGKASIPQILYTN